jgi:hypothetical protein
MRNENTIVNNEFQKAKWEVVVGYFKLYWHIFIRLEKTMGTLGLFGITVLTAYIVKRDIPYMKKV